MPDPHRLLIEMLHWAARCGAVALNYVEATTLVVNGGKVTGLEIRDEESGRMFEIEAPTVVNCAGPWCREVAAAFDRDIPELFHHSLAFNILLDRKPFSDFALAVAPHRPQGGRTYFLVPWKERILAGTFHASWGSTTDQGGVDAELSGRFLDDLNMAIPSLEFRPEEIMRTLWGFVPARRSCSDKLVKREIIRHHADLGGPQGLFSISGVKFTNAHSVAEKTLRKIHRWSGLELPASRQIPPPAADRPLSWMEFEQKLESHGDRAREYLRRLVTEESVMCSEDLMLRRTDWGLDPSRAAPREALVASLLE